MSKPTVSSTSIPIHGVGSNRVSAQGQTNGHHIPGQVCWPDFDETELTKALRAFNQRKRRFGALPPEE